MDPEIQATCNALGFSERDGYRKEPDCLGAVKDLIRFLKHDNDEKIIRRQLGQAKIVQKDLIPIVKYYSKEKELFEATLRLLVNLTQPALLCFEGKAPNEKTIQNHYLEIEGHLREYKEAFADALLIQTIVEKLTELLQLEWEECQEEDRLTIERLLVLVRNVLHASSTERFANCGTVHDRLIELFHQCGLEDLLLYLAHAHTESMFTINSMEIVSLMFKYQDASELAKVERTSQRRIAKDVDELERLRQREFLAKKASQWKHSARHTSFGGTYVLKNIRSFADRELIHHKPLAKVDELDLSNEKKISRRGKVKKLGEQEDNSMVESSIEVKLILKEFSIQFLSVYNTLMHRLKDLLFRRANDHDVVYYFWMMRFFLEFNRSYQNQIEYVSEVVNISTCHTLQTFLDSSLENMLMDRTERALWTRRMHIALQSYKELFMTMAAMYKIKDETIHESVKILLSNVFYVPEYGEVFLNILKKFDDTQMSISFLSDLIESVHIYFKLLETFTQSQAGVVLIQKKKAKRRRRKQKKRKPKEHEKDDEDKENEALSEEDWTRIQSDVESALRASDAEVDDQFRPIDVTLDVPEQEQIDISLRRIQRSLKNEKCGEAIALLRSARELWPKSRLFGETLDSSREELSVLKSIYLAPLSSEKLADDGQDEEEYEEDAEDDAEFTDEEDEAELAHSSSRTKETELHVREFLFKFIHPKVLRCYVVALKHYSTLNVNQLHAVLKFLHRVGWQFHFMPMLFQLRLFRILDKFLNDPMNAASELKELRVFAVELVRQFVAATDADKRIFAEVLCWKEKRDAIEIEHGVDAEGESSKKPSDWSEDDVSLLSTLYDMYKGDSATCLDEICTHMPHRTRRNVAMQLVRLGVIQSTKELTKFKAKKKEVWPEELEAELRDVFARYRSHDEPLEEIRLRLSVKKTKKQVVAKLLELDLIQSEEEIVQKTKKTKTKKHADEDEEEDEDVESESEMLASVSVSKPQSLDDAETLSSTELAEALDWLVDALQEEAAERSDTQKMADVALVPLSALQSRACFDLRIVTWMRQLGLREPNRVDHQYWRIPLEWSEMQLTEVTEKLSVYKLSVDGAPPALPRGDGSPLELVLSPEKATSPAAPPLEPDAESGDKADLKRRLSLKRAALELLGMERKRKRKEPEESAPVPSPPPPPSPEQKTKKKRRALVASDSESEGGSPPPFLGELTIDLSSPKAALIVSDESSGDGQPPSESDAREAPHSPAPAAAKGRKARRIVVDSDSDEG